MLSDETNRNEDFLQCLRDMPRASPPPEVWANIERMTAGGASIRMLKPSDWRRTAVAAAVVIMLNSAAVAWSLGRNYGSATTADNDITLVSDYQLYD